MLAVNCGKLKQACGMLRLVSASLSWVELQESLFRVAIPIFKNETFYVFESTKNATEVRFLKFLYKSSILKPVNVWNQLLHIFKSLRKLNIKIGSMCIEVWRSFA